MSGLPRRADFEAQVGTDLRCAEAGIDLTLTAVRRGADAPGVEQFAIDLTGPADVALQQGIQTLEHTVLGRNDIFIVPIGADASSRRYEAVFCLAIDPDEI